MKPLQYLTGTNCIPATEEQINEFIAQYPGSVFSPTFLAYCRQENGGVPAPCNEYFKTRRKHRAYWQFCRRRVINSAGEIDVNTLLGINPTNSRFDLNHWANNAHRIWKLDPSFFVIAYDGIGSKIVSKLLADDDRVYFWEPHVEPHFFLIADNLEEFYQGLSKAPFCFENTSLFQKLPRFIKRFFH